MVRGEAGRANTPRPPVGGLGFLRPAGPGGTVLVFLPLPERPGQVPHRLRSDNLRWLPDRPRQAPGRDGAGWRGARAWQLPIAVRAHGSLGPPRLPRPPADRPAAPCPLVM